MSARKTLRIDAGTDYDLTVRVRDDNGPEDLTGTTATLRIYQKGHSRHYYSTSEPGNEEGWIKITIPNTTPLAPGRNAYTLDLQRGDKIERLLYGTALVVTGYDD